MNFRNFILFLSAFLLSSSIARAQNCQGFFSSMEKSKNMYMVKVLAVEDMENISNLSRKRSATLKVEVLKVYKGNISKLRELDTIYATVSCNGSWGPSCRILEDVRYPFYKNQTIVVFTNEPYKQKINVGRCGANYFTFGNETDIDIFDQTYRPRWPKVED